MAKNWTSQQSQWFARADPWTYPSRPFILASWGCDVMGSIPFDYVCKWNLTVMPPLEMFEGTCNTDFSIWADICKGCRSFGQDQVICSEQKGLEALIARYASRQIIWTLILLWCIHVLDFLGLHRTLVPCRALWDSDLSKLSHWDSVEEF